MAAGCAPSISYICVANCPATTSSSIFEALATRPVARLASVMDHTPGQRHSARWTTTNASMVPPWGGPRKSLTPI